MYNYVICTDSACDISAELLAEWGVPFRHLTFRFNGEDDEYTGADMAIESFYDRMRKGSVAKTAAVNSEAFMEVFRPILAEGKDVLYLGFSSGLSTTYNSGRLAAAALQEEFPERKIITVDTLAASAGLGLLLYLTLEKQKNGATITEAAKFAEDTKLHLCQWFTVDDLVYLKRGGRISPLAAVAGNLMQIKPILHVDDEGHLIKITTVRGRKKSLEALGDKFGATALEPNEKSTVFISHGDCEEEAKYLAEYMHTKFGANVKLITHVGAVIGAHSGPGTMALFFVGKER